MNSQTIYLESFIWDDHAGFEMLPDVPLAPLLEPWREAGVGYLSINVAYDPQPWYQAIENIASLRRRIPLETPYCSIVTSVDDVDRAQIDGKMAVTFDIEGMNSLNGRIDLVQLYYEMGVRHILIAYNRNNLAGSGCHDEDIGLTDFGCHVIDEMNRVGMVVDCSHSGFKTSMAAMERSTDPVIFSHSNAKGLVDHDRNINERQIRACAETGGVVGINGINLFLGEAEASPGAVARHAAYVAELTGPEHVGLSLDYAPDLEAEEGADENRAIAKMLAQSPRFWPKNAGYDDTIACLDVRRLPEVTEELVAVGFDAFEIAGILGGNFKRVAQQVWK